MPTLAEDRLQRRLESIELKLLEDLGLRSGERLRRKGRHTAHRWDFMLGPVRVGSCVVRFDRVADFLVHHYKVERLEAVLWVLGIFREMCAGAAGSWLAELAHDQYLRRELQKDHPDRLEQLLRDPVKGIDALRFNTARQAIWLETKNRATLERLAAAIATGVKRRNAPKRGRPPRRRDAAAHEAANRLAAEIREAAHKAKQEKGLQRRRERLASELVRLRPDLPKRHLDRLAAEVIALPPAEIGKRIAREFIGDAVPQRLIRPTQNRAR